jgi:hypothetical protein
MILTSRPYAAVTVLAPSTPATIDDSLGGRGMEFARAAGTPFEEPSPELGSPHKRRPIFFHSPGGGRAVLFLPRLALLLLHSTAYVLEIYGDADRTSRGKRCAKIRRTVIDTGIKAERTKLSKGSSRAKNLAGRAWRVLHIGETDCVADDTVLIGPVSTSNSLLAGNLQGIFEDFRLIRQFSSPFSE